ncbi:hypothetical protein K432DRAFT_404104 [Lepidopterella palustris CBS 459.81]|uniref:Myb-like domain-containing protein n=1 Tax=Lepidopterella palustris CBS 459.81 TaxID=1314670 RepID=A0A8E2ECA2_9PEZI|nr:hypothetical protein K432DRAFT_404104 [Lepidopterella palustris CBS 459.81]
MPDSATSDTADDITSYAMGHDNGFEDFLAEGNFCNTTSDSGEAFQYFLANPEPDLEKACNFTATTQEIRDYSFFETGQWNSFESWSEQSDGGQSFSSLGSLDQLSPNETNFNSMKPYLGLHYPRTPNWALIGNEYTCAEGSFLDPRLSTGVQIDPRQKSFEKTDTVQNTEPTVLQIGFDRTHPDPELSWSHPSYPSSCEHYQQDRSSYMADIPTNATSHPLTPQSDMEISSGSSNDRLSQPSKLRSGRKGNDDMGTIRFLNPRRKTEDYFLVTSKRAGMTYKEIRQKGGLHAAESTLRGRFRALTKERKDRVRKPLWTENDVLLLEAAVTRDIDELETTGAYKNATAHLKLTKVSWKKVSDYIASHGGSYRFGNATCKKKWMEIHGVV